MSKLFALKALNFGQILVTTFLLWLVTTFVLIVVLIVPSFELTTVSGTVPVPVSVF